MTKNKMICDVCGSENVSRDAWASWDYEKQEWVLQSVFDDAFCHVCEDLTGIEKVEEKEDA